MANYSAVFNPKRLLQELPGPHGYSLLGNMWHLGSSERHILLDQWVEEFGPMYLFRQGPKPVVVISDAELQSEVLLDRPGQYRRMGTIETVFDEMNIGSVFSAEGRDWQRQRKVVTQMFSTRHQQLFLPTLTAHVERLQAHWIKAAKEQTGVDVQQDLLRLSLDVIAAFAFGIDINSRENEGETIHDHLQDIFVALFRRVHALVPYWRYIKLPIDRQADRAVQEMQAILSQFIAIARQRMADQPALWEEPTNFLEALIAKRDEKNQPTFTDEEIVGNLLVMLLAGEDAVANVTTWSLYYLCAYPEVQQKLQAEIDQAMTADPQLEAWKTLKNLTYMEAVINETLRLRPADHTLFMEADDDVELGGVAIPKGTVLFLLIRSGMQTDHNFGLGEEFHPERWLAARNCPFHGAHNRQAFIPFGLGARMCPGRTLSYVEMKKTLAMVAHNFDISFAGGPPVMTEDWGIIMTPRGLSVRFTPRTEA